VATLALSFINNSIVISSSSFIVIGLKIAKHLAGEAGKRGGGGGWL
jgi:hypothetical protein